MATLHGRIFDATSDVPVAAKVHILDSTGHFFVTTCSVFSRGQKTEDRGEPPPNIVM